MAQDCLVLLFVCLFFFPSISLEQTTLCTNQISETEVVDKMCQTFRVDRPFCLQHGLKISGKSLKV